MLGQSAPSYPNASSRHSRTELVPATEETDLQTATDETHHIQFANRSCWIPACAGMAPEKGSCRFGEDGYPFDDFIDDEQVFGSAVFDSSE